MSGCNLCRGGWLDHWPELSNTPDPGETGTAYCTHVPCNCAAGLLCMGYVFSVNAQRPSGYPDEQRRINLGEMSRRARLQNGHLNRLAGKVDAPASVTKCHQVSPSVTERYGAEVFDPDTELADL